MKIRFAFSIALAFTFVVSGLAQSLQRVSLVAVSVTDLRDFYPADKDIYLTPVSNPPESLHARMFYDSIANLKRYGPGPDHCIRYETNLITGIGRPNRIDLHRISDQKLVRRGPDGAMRPVTVTLVFETGVLPEVGRFGLVSRQAVDQYFRHAIELHLVAAPEAPPAREQVAQQFMQGLKSQPTAVTPYQPARVGAEKPSPIPCFDVNPAMAKTSESMNSGVTLVATADPVGCNAAGAVPAAKPAGF